MYRFGVVCGVTMLLVLSLVGCVSSPAAVAQAGPEDRSVASAFYRAEQAYQASQTRNDAIGMAHAVQKRKRVLDTLERNGRVGPTARLAFQVSTEAMQDETRRIANGNADTLARIDVIFSRRLYDGGLSSGGLFGSRNITGARQIDVTVGMELQAWLQPGRPEVLRLPVTKAAGTTVFVEPVQGLAPLSLTVQPVASDGSSGGPGCQTVSDVGRLACFLPAGRHSELEIVLSNEGASRVTVVIFISGDARSVGAALASE